MKKLLYIGLFLLGFNHLQAQDVQFSQYFTTSLYLNPAFAAVYVDPSVFINYRRPIDNSLIYNESSQVSVVVPFLINEGSNLPQAGIGVMAYNTNLGYEGVFQISGALLNYAHNFTIGTLGTEVIAIGVQSGYEYYRVSFSELRWGTGFNPFYGYDDRFPGANDEFDDQTSHLLLNAGIMYFYNRERNFVLYNYSAFSGFSVTNLNRPEKTFVSDGTTDFRAPMLFKYHGGIEFQIGQRWSILPNIIAQYLTGNVTTDAGIYGWYSIKGGAYSTGSNIKLVWGAWYRLKDSFNLLAGVNYNTLSIKASYDLNSSIIFKDPLQFSRNHFEVSLQYNFSRENRIRKVSNPLF